MLRVIVNLFILVCILSSICYAHAPKVKVSAYNGILILGCVDDGGFANFTGPNINSVYKHSKFVFVTLPSLRFKEDKETPKNAFVTPNLGVGFIYSCKLFAVQIPLYYNAKTAIQNGNWQIGCGLGLRLNELNTLNKRI